MSIVHVLHHCLQQKKYAINAKMLGDDAPLAWTNLGYWQQTKSYPIACRQMADHLAQAVDLHASDHVLDVGCGRGASLLHWQQQYQIQQLSAVEWQETCVQHIQQHQAHIDIQQGSFLELKPIFPHTFFNVVLCIDAAYHHSLQYFLASVKAVLHTHGRIAFHYLILSEQWYTLSEREKKRYGYVLKAADVDLQHLFTWQDTIVQLQQAGFVQIQIEDLSTAVFNGFAQYIQQSAYKIRSLDAFKIQMTAKLCQKLYQDGLIRYVQIVARAGEKNQMPETTKAH